MTLGDRLLKRSFDICTSFVGLILVFPVILIAWVVAALETRSNGFFLQQRIGRDGKEFKVIKIKTMKISEGITTTITSSGDVRITKSGAFFRGSKIDELPQLWNVLLGQMSFVGPRPDVKGYADELGGADRVILSIRPGITGPASLKYKDEEKLLSTQDDPEEYNDLIIWPDKVCINKNYIMNYSFVQDMRYILKTIRG